LLVGYAAEKVVDLPLGAGFLWGVFFVVFCFGWSICCLLDGVVVGV
jgi:hypothetical protein